MKICFPVDNCNAEKSVMRSHFGAAPFYIVYDDSSKEFVALENKDLEHEREQCDPLASFQETKIDALVVCAIGAAAVTKFNAVGIKVYKGVAGTVAENIVEFNQVGMAEIVPESSCKGSKGCCD